MTDILRGEFGYKGLVISDNGAIYRIKTAHKYVNTSYDAMLAGVRAGTNLELGSVLYWSQPDAVEKGDLTEADVKKNVKPLFYTRMRLGEFDPDDMNPYNKITDMSLIQSEGHRKIALEAATKSFVLLKNQNNFLPMNASGGLPIVNKIAIVGPFSNDFKLMFGSYGPTPQEEFSSTPYNSLKHLGHVSTNVKGCDDGPKCKKYNSAEIINATKEADITVICIGLGR